MFLGVSVEIAATGKRTITAGVCCELQASNRREIQRVDQEQLGRTSTEYSSDPSDVVIIGDVDFPDAEVCARAGPI